MKKNVGIADKLIRVLIAFAIAMLCYFKVIEGSAATVVLIIALVLLLTALFNFCPIYRIFGLSSCKIKS